MTTTTYTENATAQKKIEQAIATAERYGFDYEVERDFGNTTITFYYSEKNSLSFYHGHQFGFIYVQEIEQLKVGGSVLRRASVKVTRHRTRAYPSSLERCSERAFGLYCRIQKEMHAASTMTV